MKLDEIGYWSEIKLDIIRDYASAYSIILAKQPNLRHVYIDAFAGAGVHIAKSTGDFVPGSPVNALRVCPPFKEYYFVDMDRLKVQALREVAAVQSNVHVFEGDCNRLLLDCIFPKVRYEDYRRGLCLLDPYGLDLKWEAIEKAGRMKSIEIFLNFPVMDMNRNVLWRNPDKVSADQAARLNTFWGDESWREAAYSTAWNLFGDPEKQSNEVIARAFQKRLMDQAGFDYVPEPLPMQNSVGATVYYLFFAAQKPVAKKIVDDIFSKYRERGTR